MPACVSSLIPSAVDQAGIDSVLGREVPADLLRVLEGVTDPRSRRGVRHQLAVILGIAVCAMLAGARSFTAIAEWAVVLTPAVRSGLGIRRAVPSETAIRRTLQAVDPELLDQAVSGWLMAARCQPGQAWRVIALDGKTARGARLGDARAVHLLAAFDVADGAVLAQTVVDGKTNEITAFAPLLDRLDIAGAVITADALHTQHRHAEYLHTRGAHYVLTVKGNQPGLHRELKSLPWKDIPAVDVTHDKGHGRIESRTVKLTEVAAGIGFPHARLAIQITRRRKGLTGNKRHTETVYAITDLSYDQVSAEQLAGILRSHWTIENRLHWIRSPGAG